MYLVIETQKLNDSTLTGIMTDFADKNIAEQKFHMILQAAAVSDVPKHGAVILDENCICLRAECYTHAAEKQ